MPGPRHILVLLLCAALPFVAGCQKKGVQAAPPATDTASPAAPPAKTEAMPAAPEAKPEKKSEPEPSPTLVVPPPKSAPPKSKPATPTAPPANSQPPATPETEPAPPRGTPPQISPRLTPREQAEYEKRTKADITLAEKNLGSVGNRELNVAQKDMAEKIRGFLAQALEAMRASDWVRARNLAQKARLLSIELVGSLS
jgi:hypothetical protein